MKQVGLTVRFNKTTQCENCSMVILERLDTKLKIAYSVNGKLSHGFYCIPCALRRKKITEQDIVDYVTNYGNLSNSTDK